MVGTLKGEHLLEEHIRILYINCFSWKQGFCWQQKDLFFLDSFFFLTVVKNGTN